MNDSLPSQYPGHDGISMGTALWDNRTKTVHFFFATCSHVPGRAAPAPAHCAHSKLLISSTDAGRTWGAVRNITSQLKTMPGIWAPGPATGVQLSDGRLLACGSYRPHPKYSASPPVRSTSQCISSDDSGLSWRVAGFANYSGEQGTGTDHQPNECQPAVLTNGSVLLNSRDVGRADGHRLLALSTDRGDSFGEARPAEGLYDYPSTEGSMIQHEQCLIVSNLGEEKADRALNDPCKTAPAVSPCGFRHNLTIHVSCNGATTWTALGSVWPGPAAYSSLASLPWRADAVGVLFESGPELPPNATAALAALVPYERLTFATVVVKTDDVVDAHVHLADTNLIYSGAKAARNWSLADYTAATQGTALAPSAIVMVAAPLKKSLCFATHLTFIRYSDLFVGAGVLD